MGKFGVRRYVFLLVSSLCLLGSFHCHPSEQTNPTFHTIAAPQPTAGSMFIFPERIKTAEGFAQAERGWIFVPLNRKKSDSDVISVEVYRFKSLNKSDPNVPPIFMLPGGPGYGGLGEIFEAKPNHYRDFIRPKQELADVVIISQRGIGPSKPTTTIETTRPNSPTNLPYDNESRIAELQAVLSKERGVWKQLGVDLQGYNVLEAAADVNDIRQALGYSKITLWGGSFGSHWSMSTLRAFPETIARAVLTGMEGPDHTYDNPSQLWDVYKRVAAEAERSEQLQALIPEEGIIEALYSMVKRVDKGPFVVNVNTPGETTPQSVLIDSTSIRTLIQGYSKGGIETWPADMLTMLNGDFEQAAKYLTNRASNSDRRFSTASFYMLDCGSGITKKRLDVFQSQPNPMIINRNWNYINGCPVWQSDLGDNFRENFDTGVPTLILQGRWDLYTPYENAEELAPYFKNSHFVTVERGPHWSLGEAISHSPKFKDALNSFITTGNLDEFPDRLLLPEPEWVVPVLK